MISLNGIKQKIKFETWMAETTVVALILGLVAYFTGNRLVDWVGAGAVLYGFKHASVSERLAEAQEAKPIPEVSCYRKLQQFFLIKEVLWVTYFIMLGSYIPLVGCGIFLLLPFWRKLWRKHHPRKISSHPYR